MKKLLRDSTQLRVTVLGHDRLVRVSGGHNTLNYASPLVAIGPEALARVTGGHGTLNHRGAQWASTPPVAEAALTGNSVGQ